MKLLLGDCRKVMKSLVSKSIDLLITSPPYKDQDGFSQDLMREFLRESFRLLKPNSLFFLNFGHLAKFKQRPFEVCLEAIDAGFKLNDTIVWVKNHFTPLRGPKRINNLTEFIFLLYKGSMPDLDRLSIGVPYKDPSNAKRYNKGLNLRCRGNVWEINYETINSKDKKLHPDRFPLELPLRCIDLSNINSGSIVLDPFMGSGTTGIAATKTGMNFIGIELDAKHFWVAHDRLVKEKIKC